MRLDSDGLTTHSYASGQTERRDARKRDDSRIELTGVGENTLENRRADDTDEHGHRRHQKTRRPHRDALLHNAADPYARSSWSSPANERDALTDNA